MVLTVKTPRHAHTYGLITQSHAQIKEMLRVRTPSFSISVPIGAWHPLLPAAFRSLRLQDATLEVALLDASGDPRVRAAAEASGLDFAYVRYGSDLGQADAIQEGWDNTRGEVLGWLNGDDVLMPWALEEAAAAFGADSGLDIWYGNSTIINAAGATTGIVDQVADIGPLILRSNTVSQPSCFFRRSCLDRVGGIDRSLHYTMDWDLWVRFHEAGFRFGRTERFLSAVYWGTDTKTSELTLPRLREISRIARKAGPLAPARAGFAFWLHGIAGPKRAAAIVGLARSVLRRPPPPSGASVHTPTPLINTSEHPADSVAAFAANGLTRLKQLETAIPAGKVYMLDDSAVELGRDKPILVPAQAIGT